MPADDAVLGGVCDGVRVGDALELTDPDQPVEDPGRVAPRDRIRNAVGRKVRPDPVDLGWWSQRQSRSGNGPKVLPCLIALHRAFAP